MPTVQSGRHVCTLLYEFIAEEKPVIRSLIYMLTHIHTCSIRFLGGANLSFGYTNENRTQ